MKTNRGFTLFELILVVLFIGTTSAFFMPKAFSSRRDFNQENAVLNLELIRSARESWMEFENPAPPFFALSGLVPREDSGPIRKLTPSSFKFLGRGGVVTGGYFYSELSSVEGKGKGVLAKPTSVGYSGISTYWLDYETNSIYELLDLGALGGQGPPENSGLLRLK